MKANMNQRDEDMFFTVCNDEGEEVKCELLLTFEDSATGKNYIVYTDNTEDEEGNTRVYANQFDPNGEESALLPIEEERIWTIIEEMLAEFQEDKDVDNMSEEELEEELRKTMEELIAILPQHKDAFDAVLKDPESVDNLAFVNNLLQEITTAHEE